MKDVLSPTSIRIEHPSTRRTMIVHINRLQHRYVRQGEKSEEQVMQDWEPPGIEHFIVPNNPVQHTQQAAHQVEDPNTQRRYPQRDRRPPDRY